MRETLLSYVSLLSIPICFLLLVLGSKLICMVVKLIMVIVLPCALIYSATFYQMNARNRAWNILCWNVRGINDSEKWNSV